MYDDFCVSSLDWRRYNTNYHQLLQYLFYIDRKRETGSASEQLRQTTHSNSVVMEAEVRGANSVCFFRYIAL